MTFKVQWDIIAADKFSATAEKIKASAEKVSKSVENIGVASEKANKKTSDMLASMKGALGKIVATVVGSAVVKSAADFQKQMRNAGAIAGVTGEEYEKLTERVISVGRASKSSLEDSAMAAQYWTGYTKDATKEAMLMTNALKLAKSTERDVASASEVLSKAMLSMNLTIDEQGKIADMLADTYVNTYQDIGDFAAGLGLASKEADKSIETMSSLGGIISALGDAGKSGAEAGAALSVAMRGLKVPSESASNAIKFLKKNVGQGVRDSAGKMLPMNKILENIHKTIKKTGMSMKGQAEFFKDLFGPRAAAMMNIASKEIENVRYHQERLEQSQGRNAAIAAARGGTFSGAVKQVNLAFQELYTTIFDESVLNFLRDIAMRIKDIVLFSNDWVKQNPQIKNIGLAILGVVTAVNILIPAMKALGVVSMITSLFNPWMLAIVGVSTALLALNEVWPNFFSYLQTAGGKIYEWGTKVFDFFSWVIGRVVDDVQNGLRVAGEKLGLRDTAAQTHSKLLASDQKMEVNRNLNVLGSEKTESIIYIKLDDPGKYVKNVDTKSDAMISMNLGANMVSIK